MRGIGAVVFVLAVASAAEAQDSKIQCPKCGRTWYYSGIGNSREARRGYEAHLPCDQGSTGSGSSTRSPGSLTDQGVDAILYGMQHNNREAMSLGALSIGIDLFTNWLSSSKDTGPTPEELAALRHAQLLENMRREESLRQLRERERRERISSGDSKRREWDARDVEMEDRLGGALDVGSKRRDRTDPGEESPEPTLQDRVRSLTADSADVLRRWGRTVFMAAGTMLAGAIAEPAYAQNQPTPIPAVTQSSTTTRRISDLTLTVKAPEIFPEESQATKVMKEIEVGTENRWSRMTRPFKDLMSAGGKKWEEWKKFTKDPPPVTPWGKVEKSAADSLSGLKEGTKDATAGDDKKAEQSSTRSGKKVLEDLTTGQKVEKEDP